MTQTWSAYSSSTNVNELTQKVREASQPRKAFSQAVEMPTGDALGLNAGDTFQYTFVPNVDTEGGVLSETARIPSTGLTPVKATATIVEYGNSIQSTSFLKNLNRLDIDDIFVSALMNDHQKVMNGVAYNEFVKTDWNAVMHATAATREFVTDGTPTVTADTELDLANLGFVVKNAQKNDMPFWDGESYLGIIGPCNHESLASDSTLSTLLSRDSGRDALNNEYGRIKNVRMVLDTHKIAFATGSIEEWFLIGADAVRREDSLPIEMRSEDDDYGRSRGLAWYLIGTHFKVLDQTLHSEERIIHVTSA